ADAVDAVLDSIQETLTSGGEINFTGFGKFSTQHRKERHGVNPRNPTEKVTIPAATVPKFSAGSTLKQAVKSGGAGSMGGGGGGCARCCRGIVDAVAPHVVGVKPQLAFFEALGADGIRAFEEVCDYARAAGLLVLADAKRGDIGSTARAYATAYLEPRGDEPPLADALTVNLYLG